MNMKAIIQHIFQKKNRRNLIVGGIALALAAAAVLAFVLITGGKPAYRFPEYTAGGGSKGGFQSEDANVTFDGDLTDAAWTNQRWLAVSMLTQESTTVKMTGYFGSDGLYFAFDVRDLGNVYYAEGRGMWLNSGIQLYVSSMNGAGSINGHGYEITLSAGGKTQVRKYTDGEYKNVPAEVYLAVKTDGEINTAQCAGYTMEAFLSYSMFDDDCESVYAMPAIIRSNTDAVAAQNRQWYCFGLENKGGTWDGGSTWWTFDKDGLVAYDVALESSENGCLTGETYALSGEDYRFTVEPKEGFFAESITVNGAEVADDLLYDKNGKAYYISELVSDDLTIEARFAELSDSKATVSGKVTCGGKAMANVRAYAVRGGYSQPLSVTADGGYSAEIPAMDGFRLFAAADGYIDGYAAVEAGGGTAGLDLKPMYLGDNANVSHPESTMAAWDTGRLFQGRIRLLKYDFFASLMNSEAYSSELHAKAQVTLPKRDGVDARAGFIFYDKNGGNAAVCLTMNNEMGQYVYNVQIISQNGTSWQYAGRLNELEDQEAVRAAANSRQGIPFACCYHNGVIEIWVNNKQVGFAICPRDENDQSVFSPEEKVAVGLHSWNNRTVFSNIEFSTGKDVPVTVPDPDTADWDVSGLAQGTVKSLTDGWQMRTLLTKDYAQTLCVSGNIALPAVAGKDTRAGFWFENRSGQDVFVALTMNCEKNDTNPEGKLYYSVQLISQKGTSWNCHGEIADIAGWQDVVHAAGDAGVPFTVYAENGRLTVGINGYLAADGVFPDNAARENIFDGDTALRVGLETWGYGAAFTELKTGDARPSLKTRVSSVWDLSDLAAGKVICTEPQGSNVILKSDYQDTVYVSANVLLPVENGKDTRTGIRFADETGNSVFIALTMNSQNGQKLYEVQIISQTAGGTNSWNYDGYVQQVQTWTAAVSAANSASGVPFAAAWNDGKLSIWLNNREVAVGVIPLDTEGNPIFAADAKAAAGLECWGIAAVYNGVVIGTERP